MRIAPRVFGILLALFIRSSAASADSGDEIFTRLGPTRISWGEIAVRDGVSVEVPRVVRRDDTDAESGNSNADELWETRPVRYRDVASIEFARRERIEENGNVRPLDARIATLIVGVNVNADESFRSLLDTVVAALRELPPLAYETWLQQFGAGSLPIKIGTIDLVYCIEYTTGPSVAGDLRVKLTEDESSNGMSKRQDPTEYCAPLKSATTASRPDRVVTSHFSVASAIEASVDLNREHRQVAEPPAPFPEGSGVDYLPPKEGADGYSSGSRSGNTTLGEEQRVNSAGVSPAGEKSGSYILKSTATLSRVPPENTKRAAVFWRLKIHSRERLFGASPSHRDEQESDLDVGIFLAAPGQSVHNDTILSNLGETLARESGSLDATTVQRLLQPAIQKHGPEQAFAVYCVPEWLRNDRARYCLATACGDVANAREVCSAIQKALDR